MADLTSLLEKYPELEERILLRLSGDLGEIMVAEAISSLPGWNAKAIFTNARQRDVIATSPSGGIYHVEVKTDRTWRSTWFVKSCPDLGRNRIWVLVAGLGDLAKRDMTWKDLDMFVLTTEEAAALWHNDFNLAAFEQGKPCDIRRHMVPDEANHAWSKVTALA